MKENVLDEISLGGFLEFVLEDARFQVDVERARKLLSSFPNEIIDFSGGCASFQASTGTGKSFLLARLLPVYLWEKYGIRTLVVTLRRAHLKEAEQSLTEWGIDFQSVYGRDNYECRRISPESGLRVAQFCRKPHHYEGESFGRCAFFEECPAILAERDFFKGPIGLTTLHKLIMTGQVVDSPDELKKADETATDDGKGRFLARCADSYDLLIIDESDQLLEILTDFKVFPISNRLPLALDRIEEAWRAGNLSNMEETLKQLAGMESESPDSDKARYSLKHLRNVFDALRAQEAMLPTLETESTESRYGGPYVESNFLPPEAKRSLSRLLPGLMRIEEMELTAFKAVVEESQDFDRALLSQIDTLQDLRRKLFGILDESGNIEMDALDVLLITPERERDSIREYHQDIEIDFCLRGIASSVFRLLEPFDKLLFISATSHIRNPRTFIQLPQGAQEVSNLDPPPGAENTLVILLQEGMDLRKRHMDDYGVKADAQCKVLLQWLEGLVERNALRDTLIVTTNYDEANKIMGSWASSLTLSQKVEPELLDANAIEAYGGTINLQPKESPSIFVAPAATISRGFNIVDSEGKASIKQIMFFSVPNKPFGGAGALLLYEYLRDVENRPIPKRFASLLNSWTQKYAHADALVTISHAIGRAFRGQTTDCCAVILLDSRFERMSSRVSSVKGAPPWIVEAFAKLEKMPLRKGLKEVEKFFKRFPQ